MNGTRRNRLPAFPAIAALVVALAGAGVAVAQSVDDCLACHADDSLTGTRGGREIPVHVDGATFAASVHGSLACVDCHQDLSGQGEGHGDDAAPVDCATCHAGEAKVAQRGVHSRAVDGPPAAACADCHGNHAVAPPKRFGAIDCAKCHQAVATEQRASLHGVAAARGDKLAPTCITCHGSHAILPHKDPASPVAVMNVPLLCGRCHKQGTEVSLHRDIPQADILEHYADSIHGQGLFEKGLTVTAVCTSCHTPHFILPHTDPRSSIAAKNLAGTCMQCHGQIERVHRKVIEGRLWEEEPHKIPACVDCHQPHEIRKVFYDTGLANKDCMTCHGRKELAVERDGKPQSLFVDLAAYSLSTHGKVACAQCHTEVSPSHDRPCETITARVDCGICHAAQVEQYGKSTHGQLAAKGDGDAPGCLDCHAYHETKSKRSPSSPTFARNVPQLCARCHRVGEQAAVRIHTGVPDIVQSYADSVHGRGLTQGGLVVSATCVNCHSSHGELPPSDPNSTVNRKNLPATCGTCHHGIQEAFEKSIHATGSPKNGQELPVCEDCHSAHNISQPEQAGFRTLMMGQCGRCHEEQAKSFFETFHGKVSQLGTEGAAKCSDCHGAHDILPTTDPQSHLSRANVVETCGKCHEGSHRQFAGYLTHATHHDKDRYPWLYWSFRFMTTLLVGTLTFFLIHTVAWLVRLFRTRHEWQHHKDEIRHPGQKFYRRFTTFQRSLHIMMMLSFFTLALTGMTIKFSYAGWAQMIATALGGQPSMAVLHRLGGLLLFTVFGLHLWDLPRKRRELGWTWKQMVTGPGTILFTLQDLKDILGSLRWFFGLGPRPRYGRYTYWEKFDYFAVAWGVVVIGSTGLVLWFPELLTRILPGWSINVATIIHSDEALLATGFIFTIHFFNTHFRPDKFPMDPVIFTGRVPIEELKYDKPAEYAALVESGRLEEHLVEAYPKPVERGFRIFGFAALTIGLTLIVLIVYAILFAYR